MALHNAAHWPGILVERLREQAGLLWKLEARLKGARLRSSTTFGGRPIISVARGSCMSLANGVVVRSAARNTPLGGGQPCVLRTLSRWTPIPRP